MSFDNIANVAAEATDLTDTSSAGFTRELPEAGKALFRLRDYIELGYFDAKNPKHKPALKCQLVFELNHPKHMREHDGEKFPDLLIVRVNYARGAKSRYIRLFNKMNYSGNKTHFAQMLGDAFLGDLFHKKSEDGKNTYVNLDDDNGEWHIGAPRVIDPLSESVTEVPVPELHGESRLFLWHKDTVAGLTDEQIKEMWDSIYIEGEYDDGKSKNFLQGLVRDNNEWANSRISEVVDGNVVDLPNAVLDAALVQTTDALPEELPAEAAGAVATEAPEGVDPLAALGLA